MATTTLKGKVQAIGPITQVGDNKTDLQYMILFVPGYHDGFEKKGRDNVWCLQALGKKIGDLKMTEDLTNKIVTVNCYLDSQFIEPKETGQNGFYSVNATIASFVINEK
jgi:hypothetical protein